MERGQMVTVYLLGLCCSMCAVAAIPRAQMFPYGMLSGDSLLEEGDDETSKVISLPKPFYFYDTPFYQLYVATNGFISAQDLPMETQYVDDGFPTDFPVVAPFLADMDTSGGRGQIFYRVTETPSVLNRVAQEVRRGFPDAEFTPTHAVVATWENVAAYEEPARTSGGTSNKVNTFQAVIGYDESDSYALFLYPEGGLNFFGTRPKESFKVAIELAARVGFSRGEVSYLYFSRTEGPHYSVTSDEQSIKRLTQVGNTGIPGLWLFHTGNRYFFDNIVPASTGGILATPLPREHDHTLGATTPEYNDFEEYEDNSNFEPAHQEEDGDFPLTGEDLEFRPAVADETLQSRSSDLPLSASEVSHGGEDLPLTSEPRHGSEVAERQYAPPPPPPPQEATPDGGAQWSQEQRPQIPVEVGRLYPPRRNEPPLSSGGHVVSVEEDVDFDTGVIHYTTENKETCARFKQQCSQNAFCSDYATGFCCHCQPGFYGNGRHCLPEAAPQRVSGKLSGTVTVGLTPVELNNIDLHAYIVVGDGRAYTAVSEIPEPVGWALMPAAPIGELFGWLFALELPNSQAGFKTTGAEFTRHAELVFYPGNQRLLISQTGRGLDENNHFTVDTVLSGSIPFLPPAAEVTMDPFKETYHYYPSVATSNSVREFTVVSPDGGSESFSFQLKQNITYRDCRHDSRVPPLETQQITMERVFVMYVKEERILRYAITNKISPVGGLTGPELVNPCYDGSHDCDTTAQCIPLEDKAFQCRCGTGYSGDGHNCQDIDECAEGLSTCGAHSQCINLPGSHRCRCQAGYEFGFDGRTCVDMDECRSSPCHGDARCTNSLGSFQCQCQNGFYGDGFLCSQQGQTDRTKSQCEEHRDRLQGGLEQAGQLPVGIFVPQCDSDGRYRPLQCHGSTGHCWCVDSRGQERAGTRTPPGTAPTDCDRHEQPQQPKTQCEHHRDSIQTTSPEGYPIVGAFVPQCDANGRYTPQQCHGSTGHCWCVDSQGQERHGTRTPPGTTPIDCERPDDRPKTHCEQHRDSVQTTSPLVGAFVPQCDANGQYTPLQCHGSTGHCWCVDSQGQERPRTRTSPGAPPTDCDKPDEPDRTKTHCERHRDSVQTTSPEGFPLVGAFVPQCDANGQYTPQQCHGSTGHCWCVDNRGQERPGTRTSAGSTPVDCDKPEQPKTQCEQHRDSIQTISPEGYPVVGSFVPQCDSSGHYTPLQCHGSTGHCWCVDSQGQERVGTRTLPGTTPTNCDKPEDPERLKTHCEQHRDSVQTTSPEGYPILGAFVPQCDANGQYTPQQCHGSSGHCWCVDNRGQERPGTRTPPGATPVDCAKPERPKSHCELHRDGTQTEGPEGYPPVGAFVPQCDANGHYTPQQCHGSSGHCWCVDSQGQERSGTRTPPGATPFDCEKAERPRSHCELHRDRIHTTSPEGYPLAGAFVPQCDANGQYIHQQCHGSSGHCWCVDSQGQERPGTRTPPGATPFDCDKPEQPKTQCEQHRDSIQTISPEGYPVVGSFVPQCDSSGHYTPLQCHGSTGHCWCVDSQGQERVGTRTLPGTTPTNCDKPEDPERLKTHCEQHRDSVQTTSPEGYPILGAFVPQCDANGQYTPQQCHGSSGHCWCVDNQGQERPGTRTPPGATPFNCDKQERPQTHCEQHRDRAQATGPEGKPIPGAYIPHCDTNGRYTSQQCHGSTGHCWCVDSHGQERPGTRTPPGTTPIDCERPNQRPKTHCEHHRASVQTTSPEGYPLVGAFVPQCDAHGQYTPQQCHGSIGQCWCVDSNGQERAGTRTPSGVPPVDCDAPVYAAPTERPESVCERWRSSLMEHYGGKPEPQQYLPQCEPDGQFSPIQCYGETTYCWCVDQDGREVPGTRSNDVVKPACLPSVAPPTVRPLPRPDVTPPSHTDVTLLYAQGQKIGALPLNGSRLDASRSRTLLTLHGSIVVGLSYDCKQNQVYWTDLSARTINRASMVPGAEPEILINSNLVSPEGLAVDVNRRLMFWVDSNPDLIERSNLDGSDRRTLFDRDLVNPRAIIVVSSTGSLYWTDWNREAPKIESASVDGQNRRVVVSEGIGLPNALTYDYSSGHICWADAGTKRLECVFPDGSRRRVINPSLNYPFSMVYHRNHFYYTDWRRDGVITVSKDSGKLTDEYLPDQRSHLYGIAIATSHCLSGNH
ncbi:nidogen-2 isoform X22 [Hippocampus comes]|uniref:nidogen-2 isoform X22 n=1 Tax=Hippocampus comes TaxID=109280 RepID=UPI00094EB37A|nr:PREDICTED: nidogen-2 isoform X22 [Hippocampus comes]